MGLCGPDPTGVTVSDLDGQRSSLLRVTVTRPVSTMLARFLGLSTRYEIGDEERDLQRIRDKADSRRVHLRAFGAAGISKTGTVMGSAFAYSPIRLRCGPGPPALPLFAVVPYS